MKSIEFDNEMMKALLSGDKTVTRRKIKLDLGLADTDKNDKRYLMVPDSEGDYYPAEMYYQHKAGDIVFIKETWCYGSDTEEIDFNDNIKASDIIFMANNSLDGKYKVKWRPSIHLKEEDARVFLEIKEVYAEKLQEISNEDALKEGAKGFRCACDNYACENCYNTGWLEPPVMEFVDIWDNTIRKEDMKRYSWEANPWVYVVSFKIVNK